MNKWIKVEDKLPELKVRVLVFERDGFGVLSARLSPVGWYLEGCLDIGCNVTHWMPLPKEPEK